MFVTNSNCLGKITRKSLHFFSNGVILSSVKLKFLSMGETMAVLDT